VNPLHWMQVHHILGRCSAHEQVRNLQGAWLLMVHRQTSGVLHVCHSHVFAITPAVPDVHVTHACSVTAVLHPATSRLAVYVGKWACCRHIRTTC
jgi:hypothetical protein